MPLVVFFNHYMFHPAVTGGSLVVANHADYLVRRGMDLRIVVLLTEGEEHLKHGFEDRFGSVGIRFIKLSRKAPSFRAKLYRHFSAWNLHEHAAAFDMLAGCPEVREEIGQADILVTNSAASAALLKCTGRECVSIVETHNRWASLRELVSTGGDDLHQEAALEDELLARFDHVIAISPQEKSSFLEHLPPDRVWYVPPYVPIPPSDRQESPKRFDIGFLSSAWSPNVESIRDFYFESYLPELKPRGIKFVLAGKVSDEFGIHDYSVHKLGRLDKVADFYDQCRIVICPIMYGAGCNIKLLEAMTLGKPVVATGKAVSGLNVDRDRLLIAEDFRSFTDHIIALIDSPYLQERYARRSIEQIDAGHTRDRYDGAMDLLYEAASKEVFMRGKTALSHSSQRNRPQSGATTRSTFKAVVVHDPSVWPEDLAVYRGLLRDEASDDNYRIHECSFKTDCRGTSIGGTRHRHDDFICSNPRTLTGRNKSREQKLFAGSNFVHDVSERIAALTTRCTRGILQWTDRGRADDHSGTIVGPVGRLMKVLWERLESARSVKSKRTPFPFTAREIGIQEAVRTEFLSIIDRLGLESTDLIVLPVMDPLKLAAVAQAVQERGVVRIPRLKFMFDTSVLQGKPSSREYFGGLNRDVELYRHCFELLADYRSTGRLEFIAATEPLKYEYEVMTAYKFRVWPGTG
ncbi:MAG: glycosyltransferase [Desulfomonilaceae bacterium]|nr:glycosyltransferase [Desulfomonilaceae bacterium]